MNKACFQHDMAYRYFKNLHKPVTGKSGKRKVYSSFITDIWGADLAEMQLIRKFN